MGGNLTPRFASNRPAPRSKRNAIVSIASLSLLLSACAKVGDPLPPIAVPPLAVEALNVVQTGGTSVKLVFSLLQPDLRELRVFRSCGKPLEPGLSLQPLAVITFGKASEPGPTSPFEFQDPEPVLSEVCQYSVVVIDRKGRPSPPSPFVSTSPEAPSLPPDGLTAEVEPEGINLRWNVPKQTTDRAVVGSLEGYLVNSKHIVSTPDFLDRDAKFGETVTYRVQAITRKENPTILSAPSSALAVMRKDTFPPVPPINLSAIFVLDGVELLWDANGETDLTGYFVYRGPAVEQISKFSPLITVNRFTDNSVSRGQTHYYAVSALDTNGNESPLSEPVRVYIKP